jgi:ubiquinol-cytochrome c reductase cytochrome c1 subunit
MNHRIVVFLLVTLLVATFGASSAYAAGGAKLETADIEPGNIKSLQRGARNYMNYCSGCHSLKYMRYSTIGKHLDLTDEQLIENLMFNAEKTFETIQVAMPAEASARWLGVMPPDLSLTARAKGPDYIYSFLKGFYIDDERTTGVNNTVLKGTSMPHVLWELDGLKAANFETKVNEDGSETETLLGFEPVVAGVLSPAEYNDFVRDTVNFLAFVAEPMRSERRTIGVWVILFLIVFGLLAYSLKKEIWKDVK